MVALAHVMSRLVVLRSLAAVANLLLHRQELKGIDAKAAPGVPCPVWHRGGLPSVPVASLRPLLVQAQQRFGSVRA